MIFLLKVDTNVVRFLKLRSVVFRQQNNRANEFFDPNLAKPFVRPYGWELDFTLKCLGEWKAKMMKNPAYKGKWVHPGIDNPYYLLGYLGYIPSEEYQSHKKAAADDKAALLL